MELLFVLLPAGGLFGLGAAWVVFSASSDKPIWSRALRVVAVLLGCTVAPVLFFMALGSMAKLTQPSLKTSVMLTSRTLASMGSITPTLQPNKSIGRTASGTLRVPTASAHFQR
jgi:hypothetical protein